MTGTTPSKPDKTASGNRDIRVAVFTAVAAPLATAAFQQATKLAKAVADRRGIPRLRNEAVYRNLYKVRVIGETALTLDNDCSRDERQHMVADAAGLRDALHEQLPDLRLSSAAQKSGMLDAAQAAIGDVDRLVAAMNKWALNSSDASQTRALQQAVSALGASENALLSRMHKARRRRSHKGEEEVPLTTNPNAERKTAGS